ncbi:MAG TPA: metallophosphoesterase, partial [Pyrinomonadaceae bacterium]
MSTFVIGDVHGRRAQLKHLLSLLPREAGRDTLVLLGDLIDRGEDIPGTISDVIELQQAAAPGAV